ncbi:MAG: AmmeMemoRadiSam system protein B [Thermoplasmatota archaeon]
MRRAAVAGQFYPRDPSQLSATLAQLLGPDGGVYGNPSPVGRGPPAGRLVGLVVPHAGYRYSGTIAAAAYRLLRRVPWPETFVVVGPAHRGAPAPMVASRDDWETPLGLARCDTDLVDALCANGDVVVHEGPHRAEHSIEVQIPFLQALANEKGTELRFVAIALGLQDETTAAEFGDALARSTVDLGAGRAMVVASSDLAHVGPAYEQDAPNGVRIDAFARGLDDCVLRAMETGDAERVLEAVRLHDVPACGPGAIACALAAAGHLEGAATRILAHATSYDVEPADSCVGYVAAAIDAGL